MIYKMKLCEYFERKFAPYELIDKGDTTAYEFIKTQCCLDPAYFLDVPTPNYYLYDTETINNIVNEIEHNDFSTCVASGKSLYYFKKLLGVYDNGISQSINDITKEYNDEYQKDGIIDFYNMLNDVTNKIKEIAMEIMHQKINILQLDVIDSKDDSKENYYSINSTLKINPNYYLFMLKRLLKNHGNIPISAIKLFLSQQLYDYLEKTEEINNFEDLIRLSKHTELDIPMLNEDNIKELKRFIHSCGCLMKGENIEDISLEIFDNMYITDWKNPARSKKVFLTSLLHELLMSNEAIYILENNKINNFEDLLKLDFKEIEEMFGTSEKEETEVKRLILSCNAYDFISNSDNVYFPPRSK